MNNHRINSGLTDFDNGTGGLAGGQLITIAGRPAMGKTAFAITLMMNIGITFTDYVAEKKILNSIEI